MKRSMSEASDWIRPYVVKESETVGGKSSTTCCSRSVSNGKAYLSARAGSSLMLLNERLRSSGGKYVKISSAMYYNTISAQASHEVRFYQ